MFNFSEAVETRHALHGVIWPSSNPKCLNVDFGNEEDMEKAVLSTMEEPRIQITTENRDAKNEKEFGWSKDPFKNVTVDDRSRVSCAIVSLFVRSLIMCTYSHRIRDQFVNGMSGRRKPRKTLNGMNATGTAARDHRSVRAVGTGTSRKKNDQISVEAQVNHQVRLRLLKFQ